jgi:hypothetical protein
LDPTGATVALLDNLATTALVTVATGATLALLDSRATTALVTVATGATLALLDNWAIPTGLPLFEPTGVITVLLDSKTDVVLLTVATDKTDVLALKAIARICVFAANGVSLALELKLIDACLATDATGVTLALDLSLTTAMYLGVNLALEDMETLAITVLAGGFIVTLAELPADTVPVLVPEETPNGTPKTPNLGPPRRPASGVAIF